VSFAAPGLLANDADADVPANTLTAAKLTDPLPGAVSVNADGSFTYAPASGYSGTDSFTYRAFDGSAYSTSATVTITVTEGNQSPVLATIGNKTVDEGTLLTFAVTATDADVPANTLTFSLGAGAPAGATINASTGAFSWTASAAGSFNITFIVSDGKGGTDSQVATITVSATAQLSTVSIFGPNRFATAIEISKRAFPAGSEYVIIATGMNWPDALGGSALAGALDAPILLTRQDVLPTEVRDEIVRLKGTKASITAIVLGGTPAVSAAVFSEIDAIAGVTMEPRLFGPNRYATANAVAARTIEEMQKKPGGYDGTAFVATGANFPDALGASPLAAKKGWPIYLSNPALGSNTALVATMKAVEVTDAILLGGANVVSDLIRAELGPTYETRLYGPNRYDTAVAVASYGVANAGLSWDRLAIATGENFPDALAGGVLQGKDGSVLLLTPTLSLNANVAAKLSANKASITEVRFLGSTAAVSQAVRNAVVAALQ
jgi:VCBS repeat-containing protein